MVTRTLALFVLVALAACDRRGDPDEPMKVAPPKRITSLNVVTLGDSLANGAGDESGKGIAGRLRDELHQRGVPTVQTTNLGVNGAMTGDLIARLKQSRVRDAIAGADAVVLSIGANDLFRNPATREQTLSSPLLAADRILTRVGEIVAEIHAINPRARILILGGYNPVPRHAHAPLINQYLGMWDEALSGHFEDDPLVAVVQMSDLVVPSRLSRLDSFHPGGSAYAEMARRIAGMLT